MRRSSRVHLVAAWSLFRLCHRPHYAVLRGRLGRDGNIQWQTVQDTIVKDVEERQLCREISIVSVMTGYEAKQLGRQAGRKPTLFFSLT